MLSTLVRNPSPAHAQQVEPCINPSNPRILLLLLRR